MIDFSKGLYGGGDLIEMKTINLDVLAPEIDTTKAVKLFSGHEAKIKAMGKKIDKAKVGNDSELTLMTQMGVTIQGAMKELEDLKKRILKPFKDAVKSIEAAYNLQYKALGGHKATAISKIDIYQAAKEIEARKLAEAKRKEAEEIQAKMAEEAKAAGMDAPQIEIPSIEPDKDQVVRTAKGSGIRKSRWMVEITDPDLLPRKYLQPKMKAINAAVKAGIEIPGVKATKVKKTEFRTTKS